MNRPRRPAGGPPAAAEIAAARRPLPADLLLADLAVTGATTYRLSILVPRRLAIGVGRLGPCVFPAGRYAYVGSARRNMEARLRRHLGVGRAHLHWHIDYLLTQQGVRVEAVETFAAPECATVAATAGRVVVAGFGASDCRAGCGSHLRYFGRARR